MTRTNIVDILNKHDGSMTHSQLMTRLRGFGIGNINKILENLVKEGSIKISGNTIIAIPIHRADQILRSGNENEDGSIEQTGHNQVSIPYNNTLFKVVNESGELLDEITIDEGMVDLLKAIWRHEILTTKSCEGGNGETAFICFQWHRDVDRFNSLIGHISRISGKKEWIFVEKSLEISFPPEHIAMMTKELDSKPID